jgi:DNA-binding NtrC family response regulator
MADSEKHLLLVEDEAPLRQAIAEQLVGRGFRVEQADSGKSAVARLAEFAFDAIITEVRLPGIEGSSLVQTALRRYPDIVAIVVSDYGTMKDAVEAINRGASDFICKPLQIDELVHTLESALEQRRLRSENAYLRSQLEERHSFEGIVGKSPPMQKLFQLLETVAGTNSPILITGETGTGKEIVARAVHHNSPRREHRFAVLDCSAMPEGLLEAELFGHVRGAFAGAVGGRSGRLEQAHGGTLFLDDVGTLSAGLQMRLQRVLEEHQFERAGDSHPIEVDIRLLAASSRDLAGLVATGHFREDLFRQLNAIPVHLAPLREHKEDIPLLVQHFLDKFAENRSVARSGVPPGAARDASAQAPDARGERQDRDRKTISLDGMRGLMADHWPGNVRQLENALERAVAFCGGRSQIDVSDLPNEIQQVQVPVPAPPVTLPEEGIDLGAFIANLERQLIERSLERTGGNKGAAAKLLKIKRTTLVEKLKRLERQSR